MNEGVVTETDRLEEPHLENADLSEAFNDEEAARRQHWQDSPFAVGLVDPTWKHEGTVDLRERWFFRCSASMCNMVGAGRVGNMAVLHQSKLADGRPKLNVVVGPYWPFMLCCTYPLILGVSAWVVTRGAFEYHLGVFSVWLILTVGLIVSLALVACRDPGIFYRHSTPVEEDWIWNDQALTYRPKTAKYDKECAVVVAEYDHTCPWTGTAIGERNMFCFKTFVCLVCVCIMFDAILVTNLLWIS